MRGVLVRVAAVCALAVAVGACGGDGPLTTAPEDADSPELNAAAGSGQDRGPLERVQFIHWKRGYGTS